MRSNRKRLNIFYPKEINAIEMNNNITRTIGTKECKQIPFANTHIPQLPINLRRPFPSFLNFSNLQYKSLINTIPKNTIIKNTYLLLFFPPNIYISSSLICTASESSRIYISSRIFFAVALTSDHLSLKGS